MSFARNAAQVGIATMVSRLLGFARDILVAAALGAGPAAEAFVVAFRLPSLLRRLIAEGAFNSAFVPLHAQAADEAARRRLAGEVFAGVAAGFLAITAVALAVMPWLVDVVAPGFAEGGGSVTLAVDLARITFPYCLATALMVVAGALLNVHGRFVASAYAPSLVNVAAILALVGARLAGVFDETEAARLLAWSVLAGGIAQCILVFVALKRAGIGLPLVAPRLSPGFRHFLRLAAPAVAAAGITQVNAFVALVVASPQAGAVAWLYFADRLYQLPLGIVAVAIGVTLLPDLARHAAAGDREGESVALSRALEFAAFLALPATLALVVAAGPIVAALFERDAFGPADTAATATALAAFSLGLPAYVGAKLMQPLFFARTRMRPPFLVALVGVAADVGLSVALFPHLGHVGVALAAAAAGWVNLVLLAVLAWRNGYVRIDRPARRRLAGMVAAALVMTLLLLLLVPLLGPATGTGTTLPLRLAALLGICGGGLLAYVGAAMLFGGIDLASLSAALSRKVAARTKP